MTARDLRAAVWAPDWSWANPLELTLRRLAAWPYGPHASVPDAFLAPPKPTCPARLFVLPDTQEFTVTQPAPKNLDPARVEAAQAARRILGSTVFGGSAPDVDDVIALAEFLLGEELVEDDEDADPGELTAEEFAEAPEPELVIRDRDGDTVRVTGPGRDDSYSAFVVTSNLGAYLTDEDAARVIAQLQRLRAAS